jgi:hypothetical protein
MLKSIEQRLRTAWAHETSLRLRGAQPPDVLHVLLHMSLPEAYYAIYHSAHAYLLAAAMIVPRDHMATLNVLSERCRTSTLFPDLWSMLCVGDPRGAAYSCSYIGLPQGVALASINQLATPAGGRFYDLHAVCLKTSREAFGQRVAEDYRRRKALKRLPNGFMTAHYASVPPTSLFHFLYRLRLRSNYRDADAFLRGIWSLAEAQDFYRALLRVTGASLLLLENLTSRYVGRSPFA